MCLHNGSSPPDNPEILASHFQYDRNTLHENKIDNKFPAPATVETNKIKLVEFSLHSLASHYKFLSGSTCIIDNVSNTEYSLKSLMLVSTSRLTLWVIRKFLNSERNQNAFYISPVQGSMLRPVGSPMQLDLVRWRLTFHLWSPVWPP